MGLVNQLRSAIGESDDEQAEQEPTHRCQSCGEEYYSEVATEIRECRRCGGVNVEAI